MLHQVIRAGIRLFIVTLPFWILYRVWVSKLRQQKNLPANQNEAILFLFYGYILAVISVTLMPIPLTHNPDPGILVINIVPFIQNQQELAGAIRTHDNNWLFHSLLNIFGNIALFFPLGVFLPILWPKFHRFKWVLLTAFLFSFMIEFCQYISKFFHNYRYVDIDDVILNTTGACLGFVFFKIFLVIQRRLNDAT